ncbi:hypothetical protein [Roseicyclus marinus]|uniref:Uncharacterized protein n=1 Tax=Roseicyclus marinus TaxID=2161673 RepID=A0AA48KLR5_9RHOB|nr:hypothetical protein MACH21_05380 [Roseicyclus marinus]
MSKSCPKTHFDADAALRLLEESWAYFGKTTKPQKTSKSAGAR